MTHKMIKIFVMAMMLTHFSLVSAENKSSNIVNIVNPSSNVGVQIGDILQRSVAIEVVSDKKLAPKSIPIKNTRIDGVELVDVKLKSLEKNGRNQFFIELSYQVFSNATKPTEMVLPEEIIEILDNEKLVLPAWHFWYSPLVETSLVNAKKYVQPQDKTPLINLTNHLYGLYAYLGLLLIGLIALFYINADGNWLPWMGGDFARAYRKIKRLNKKGEYEVTQYEKALSVLHQAFNSTHGRNLFANEVEMFVFENKKFIKLKSEIVAFFEMSNKTLFEKNRPENPQLMHYILSLSKQLRDVERGV